MVIGILDSGLGGLSVAEKIKSPEDRLIVVLDKGFFPYGKKTKLFLLARSYYLVQYLIDQGAELIILACNTLSVIVTDFLKANFSIPILNVFEYFLPYLTDENCFMGSYNTICYVEKEYSISCIDGTQLIEAIEKKKEVKEIINSYPYCNKKKLLLGCTHFLTLDKNLFPIETIDQIEMLKNDIKKLKRSNPFSF